MYKRMILREQQEEGAAYQGVEADFRLVMHEGAKTDLAQTLSHIVQHSRRIGLAELESCVDVGIAVQVSPQQAREVDVGDRIIQ